MILGPIVGLLAALQLAGLATATTPMVACVKFGGFPYAWPGKKLIASTMEAALTGCAGYKYIYYGGPRAFSSCDNYEPTAPGAGGGQYTDGTSSTTCSLGVSTMTLESA